MMSEPVITVSVDPADLAQASALSQVARTLDAPEIIEAGVPLLVGVGGQGFLLKFGREEEYEADSLGMRYMTKAGYNPIGQKRVMQVLVDASQGSRQPEFLSTHPYPESRVKRVESIIEKEYPFTVDNPRYELGQDAYERRMLEPLRRLPPPKQQSKPAA